MCVYITTAIILLYKAYIGLIQIAIDVTVKTKAV